MKTNFLGTVAAFAFVATGFAAQAQDVQHQEKGGAEKAAPRAQAPRAGQAEGQQGGAMKKEAPRAAEGERREPTGEAPKAAEGQPREKKADSMSKETPKAAPDDVKEEKRAEPRKEGPKAAEGERRETDEAAPREKPKPMQAEKRAAPESRKAADENPARPNAQRREPKVSGVQISREHASRIGERLREEGRGERPDFEIRVGGRVPESFSVRPLPREIIEIEPQYRGYDYFIDADEEIVFVSPESHEIVGTIAYDGSVASVDAPRRARPCPPEE